MISRKRERPAFIRGRHSMRDLSFTTTLLTSVEIQAWDQTMTSIAKCRMAFFILLCATVPAHAGTCADDIAHTQVQLDLAIEKDADSHGWKPESLSALRSHQPTPRSLAKAEGDNGIGFMGALDSLDRARAADRSGDIEACSREIARARAVLR
ncbi:hypothetical protein P0R31_06855 [Bradyrhizobium yuanmingense]|uniref:hypothetical protein n=1 Tax=Bradyrhizobium yuanmingense TaxID=108015 RepID=UPI0023B8EA89|nr:hypothetical protein [Bradyrhizobium yuanmingense]MDF0516945.1 hypothetical protein [Bradyrhizobium yuanmingense]